MQEVQKQKQKNKIQDVLLSLPSNHNNFNNSFLRRSQDLSGSPAHASSEQKNFFKQRNSSKHYTFSQDLDSNNDNNQQLPESPSVQSLSQKRKQQQQQHHHHSNPSSDHQIKSEEEKKHEIPNLFDNHGQEKKSKLKQQLQQPLQYPTHDSKSIIIRDAKTDNLTARPVELIEIREGKLILHADLLEEVLLKYEGNINFVAVHGLPATGKSAFLNKLLLSQNSNPKKFYERTTKEAIGTEGAIMWSQPIYHPLSKMHTFLLDVQGIDKSDRVNMKLQLLTMLLSDVLLYVSTNDIQQTIYGELDYLVELSNLLPYPMLDHTGNTQNSLPGLVVLHQPDNDTFYQRNQDESFDYDFDLENILFQIQSNEMDKTKNNIKLIHNAKLLKLKKLLKQGFRGVQCFIRQEEDDGEDPDEPVMPLSTPFNLIPNVDLPNKLSSFSPSGIPQQQRFTGQQNTPKINGPKDLSIFSKPRFQNELHTPSSGGRHPLRYNDLQYKGSSSGKKGKGQYQFMKLSNRKSGYLDEIYDIDVGQFHRIIGLPSNVKQFQGIPINASTFCKFATLLVEEINNETLIDIMIPANKSIAADLKRAMDDCLNNHKSGIQSLVSYEQYQSMGNIMTSLSSLRTSTQSQFHQRAGRFKFHKSFLELYEGSYAQLNQQINLREKQVFQLFQNISFGKNEEKFRYLTNLAGFSLLSSKPIYSLSSVASLNELENSFVEILSSLAKDFLIVETGLDGVQKVYAFLKLGVSNLKTLLKQFAEIYSLRFASKQLDKLQLNSNQPLLLKFQAHLDILNKKVKKIDNFFSPFLWLLIFCFAASSSKNLVNSP